MWAAPVCPDWTLRSSSRPYPPAVSAPPPTSAYTSKGQAASRTPQTGTLLMLEFVPFLFIGYILCEVKLHLKFSDTVLNALVHWFHCPMGVCHMAWLINECIVLYSMGFQFFNSIFTFLVAVFTAACALGWLTHLATLSRERGTALNYAPWTSLPPTVLQSLVSQSIISGINFWKWIWLNSFNKLPLCIFL